MNSFKLAYKLLKNNMKIYGLYLTVLIVTVVTYYNFASIGYNDIFVELTKRLQSAKVASYTCGFVLILVVIFFMWHANSFFLKQRQKETGLYMLMGISSSKIGKVFAIESIFLGSLALGIGLPVGILFSKLFFMLLSKAMYVKVQIPLTISLKAVVQLMIVFITVFIVLSIKNYRVVKKSQLIDMLNAAKMKSPTHQLSYTKGFLGVLFIIGGYILGSKIRQEELDLLLTSMSTLILVCIGTYLFFESFLAIVLNKIIKYKNIIYKNVRMISINNIFFRLNINYRTLAMTAILAASTVTAFSVSLSFKQFANDNVIMEAPYSLSYISDDINIRNKVIDTIKKSKHQLEGINDIKFCISDVEYINKDKKVDYNNQAIITSYSQIEKTLTFLSYKNKKRILEKVKPKKDEVTFILNAKTITLPIFVRGDKVKVKNKSFTIREDIKVPFIGSATSLAGTNIYVLDDSQYKELKKDLKEISFNGVKITDEDDSEELIKDIINIIPDGSKNVNARVKEYVWEYYALGIFFFLGLIMSIVFVLATFSTLYFKIMGNAIMDRNQYTMLKNIGMSKKEVAKSVSLQISIEFIIPVIVGIFHSIAAMNMLEKIMNVTFKLQLMCGIGLFLIVIVIFYLGLSRNYTKLVYGE